MRRNRRKHSVVCVWNEGYPASLELRKIYEQLPDPRAENHGLMRVTDEEDDALYPANYFLPLDLSKDIQKAIESAAELEAQRRSGRQAARARPGHSAVLH